ncbi:MAG: HPr(Ser) kinase/phosphatase [Eubacteriales bacterium]
MDNESFEVYEAPLCDIAKEFNLENIFVPEGWKKKKVISPAVNRPGFALMGFFERFDRNRIQLIGKAEHQYLSELSHDERVYRLEHFASHNPPAIIVTSSLPVFSELEETAEKYSIPLFHTSENTSNTQAAMISYLNVVLAPRITRHGVLVEVYGEGILLLGDSGIGKSETAIELVKRGHRLIADDAVELKRVSAKTIVGSAPEIIRHFIELRGIGIVDVRRVFGIGAVKDTEKIDMIIKLEHWDRDKFYDRLGFETEKTNILGIDISTTTIPVSPGRNLAVIIEVAAMNNKQRRMGYNTAEHFNNRLNGVLGKEQ